MNNNNFIMMPNSLIWNVEDKNNTYLRKHGDKITHVFSYLDGMTNRFGKTIFNIKEMITSCGMNPKSGKGKVNEQFKNILIALKNDGIIKTDIDLEKCDISTYINCIFNMPIEKDECNNNTKFFTIEHDKYLDIIDRYDGELNKLILLKVYYYINARLSRRATMVIDGQEMSHNIQVHGGKAECFYDKYEHIISDLVISENTWSTYIKELKGIGLLFYDNIGNVKKDNKTTMANNVYCLDINELDEALELSKLYYVDNGYTIIGKKSTSETKAINGLKGKIVEQKNKGKDTEKLEKKLSKLESKKSSKKKDEPINQEPKSPVSIKGFVSKEELNKELNKNYDSKPTIFEEVDDDLENWGSEPMPNFNDEEFEEPVDAEEEYINSITEDLRENAEISKIQDYIVEQLMKNEHLEESYFDKFGVIDWKKLSIKARESMFIKVKDYFEGGDIFNNYLSERLKGLTPQEKAKAIFG